MRPISLHTARVSTDRQPDAAYRDIRAELSRFGLAGELIADALAMQMALPTPQYLDGDPLGPLGVPTPPDAGARCSATGHAPAPGWQR